MQLYKVKDMRMWILADSWENAIEKAKKNGVPTERPLRDYVMELEVLDVVATDKEIIT